VFPIFKNASSSLHFQAIQSHWKIVFNEQINKLDCIEVFLREPDQRLVSGFNTFVQHTMRDCPELDQDTVIWFAKNYLFLDRHYCPQFFWLMSLSRFLSPDTELTFTHMNQVAKLTPLHVVPEGIVPATVEIVKHAQSIPRIEMYQRLEQCFYEIEQRLFERFKSKLKALKKETSSSTEALAYAQHYGLPTRLLDWSANPLVALWFAFSESAIGNFDRVVQTIRIQKWDLKKIEDEKIFNSRVARFINPQNLFMDDRMKNQEGWFSNQNINIIPKGKERSGDGLPHFGRSGLIEEDEYFNYTVASLP
jgi:hypothetical protein